MKKILFVCSAGMSTGFLINALNEKTQEKGYKVIFDAKSQNGVAEHLGGVELMCVAPQMSFAYEACVKIGKKYGVKKFYQLKAAEYNVMKAEELLEKLWKKIK